jgi:ATP-dependent Lon protease
MAAYSAGVRTIIIPADNLKDLHEVDPMVRENVTFIPCSKAQEVLSNALVRNDSDKPSAVVEENMVAAVCDVAHRASTEKRATKN